MHKLDAQAGIEGLVNIVDGKKLWGLVAYEKGEVEKKEKKAFVGRALIEELNIGIGAELAVFLPYSLFVNEQVFANFYILKLINGF